MFYITLLPFQFLFKTFSVPFSLCARLNGRLACQFSSANFISYRKAFSRSIPSSWFITRMICFLPAPECRSVSGIPVSRQIWWIQVVGGRPRACLQSRDGRGHHPELHNRSKGSGWLGRHQRVWQRGWIGQAFICERWIKPKVDQCDIELHFWRHNHTIHILELIIKLSSTIITVHRWYFWLWK